MDKQKLIVFTGSGISAESGIPTFRASDGLWEKFKIEEIASPEGFKKNPELVLQFYNDRRRQILQAKPNNAHLLLAKLESVYDVKIITQNIDDLHERAGSTKIIHLHGEILKARSCSNQNEIYPWKNDIQLGDKTPDGSQLRPHIVWFGEEVVEMDNAINCVRTADIFVVIGTSLQVYPAAGLSNYAPEHAKKFIIDPNAEQISHSNKHFTVFAKIATEGMIELATLLNQNL